MAKTFLDTLPSPGDTDNVLLGKILQKLNSASGIPVSIGDVTLTVSDLEIGAVELKDSTTNNRATINGAGQLLVSGAFAMPAGAATEAKQDAGNASLASIDGKLTNPFPVSISNFPAQQHVIVDSGILTAVTSITNPVAVTGTFWQATQPISGTVTANAGTNLNTSLLATSANQTNLTQATKITDGVSTCTITALPGTRMLDVNAIQTTAANLNATVVGTGTFVVQATLSAGSAVIGHVIIDSGTITSIAGSVGVFPSGTFAVQATLAAETTKVIGTVNQGTSPWVVSAANLDVALSTRLKPADILTGVTTVSTVTSLTQMNGAAISMNTGVRDAGTQRVTIATNDAVSVTGTFWQATQPVSIAATVNTVKVAPTTIFNGKKTVTTAGTRVTLAASTAVKSVTIKAVFSNTGTIYVGSSTVTAANGYALASGESVSVEIADLNTVNIDSSINGEGVTYLATA